MQCTVTMPPSPGGVIVSWASPARPRLASLVATLVMSVQENDEREALHEASVGTALPAEICAVLEVSLFE